MSGYGYVFRRCGCTAVADANDGHGMKRRVRGAGCPKRRTDPRHGSWWFQIDLPHRAGLRRRQLRRGGFASQHAASSAASTVTDLLAIPASEDERARLQIADLIQSCTRGGGPLPDSGTVAARYRAGLPLQPIPTLADWLRIWLRSRTALRPSTRTQYETH